MALRWALRGARRRGRRPQGRPRRTGLPTTRGLNFYLADPNLEFLCSALLGPGDLERARPHLIAMGEVAGGELDALAAEADRNPPVLRVWNERGERVDEVVRHPAYRRMEELAFERFGLAAMSHRPGVLGWPGTVPHVVKYALSYLFGQSEFGLLCPVNMTDSTARMLRQYGDRELIDAWVPRKLAVAALYARRWLESPRPPVFTAGQIRWLDALVDWAPLPPRPCPPPRPRPEPSPPGETVRRGCQRPWR